ncbi:sensor histidine kinase [Algoriphagus machipongonensis]|uniref:histidine kinase n=1 Tax=Algoriphagus machipongonensis TaxID=388413 RepID=A3HS22_9BACT|nr:sensor histidine kinase [Algoriphagus machipongonensis]EAZ82640.1 two-component system sensor histidine kinase [Algoriphagus machipongonensis]
MRKKFPKSGNPQLNDQSTPSMKRIKIYAIISLILIMVGSGVSYWTSQRISFYTSALMETQDVLQRTSELYASILERETNIRGFVITGDEDFLTNYQQSLIDAQMLLDKLNDLTSKNDTQQKNLEVLEELIKDRVNTFESTVNYFNENGSLEGFVDQSRVSNALVGYRSIKQTVTAINDEENRVFVERNRSLLNNINALPFIVGLISLFSISVGLITLFSIFHYNKAQKIASRRIQLYQEKLQDQLYLLDDSNKELEQFAYVASHDLQEPLRKITAFSDLFMEQYADKLDGEGELYLNRITVAANRMRRLITDLLEYSRAGRENNEDSKVIDLEEVMETVLDDLEIAILEKKATISVEQLPQVLGKETEFRQIFQNLISNSLKFSKQDVPPKIEISSRIATREEVLKFPILDSETEFHLISFKDNGIGFDEDYSEKIFAIFQRLHGREAFEGTGIGLSISRKILEKYNGTIYATSVKGEGSTFSFFLPVVTS